MAATNDEAWFRLGPVEGAEEAGATEKSEATPVEKTFRPYDPSQMLLLPPSLEEWLPEGHLARFVSELAEEALDLSAIRAGYTEERGYPPYDPRLMLKLLIYGYCSGQRSSRGIERRCQDDVAFRYLAAGAVPDYRSIARFRRRHQKALVGLFLQALRLCQRAGMVRLGRVALDGTKLRANASRHKAMRFQGAHPRQRDGQGTDGTEDADQGRQGRLRQAQSDRGAGVRADDHPPGRPASAAPRQGSGQRRVAAALRLPQPAQALVARGTNSFGELAA
jgi:transposase